MCFFCKNEKKHYENALAGFIFISTATKYCGRRSIGQVCQCPVGLILHFYWLLYVAPVEKILCQCPVGLILHFYTNKAYMVNKKCMCQCPVGLILHFYLINTLQSVAWTDVSMPCRAYPSFLQHDRAVPKIVERMCQCPVGLILHFYEERKKTNRRLILVSMPCRAYPSFLPCLFKEEYLHLLHCVNALSGLSFISTKLNAIYT